MYIIQLIKMGNNEVVEEFEVKSEIKAIDKKDVLENQYDSDEYYVEYFCLDCGEEHCCCW